MPPDTSPARLGGAAARLLCAAALLLAAACTPEVRGAGPQLVRPALAPDAITAADGTRLMLHESRPDGPPRARLLMLHAMSNHGGHAVAESGPPLRGAGLHIIAYDQRGHGRNPAPGIWPSREALVADAVAAIRLLRAERPDLPLYVLGESMGADVALLASEELRSAGEARLVDGWILLSGGLWGIEELRAFQAALLRLLLAVAPRAAGPSSTTLPLTTDEPATMHRVDADPLTVMALRPDFIAGVLELQAAASAAVARCCAGPTLFLYGARDPVIELVPTARALRSLPAGGGGRVGLYAEGWHMLLRDRQRMVVARDLLAFIADPALPLPSGAEAAGAAWVARGGE